MRRLRFALIVALVGIPLTPAPALACSCVIWAEVPTRDAISRMPQRAIYEATVESVWDGSWLKLPFRIVYLRDFKEWFGRPRRRILQALPLSMCDFAYQVGERYLIDAGGRFQGLTATNVCSLTRRIDHAAETIEQLKALTQR